MVLKSSILFIKSIVEGKFDLETKSEYDIILTKSKLFPATTADLIRIGLTSFKRNFKDFDSYEIIEVGAVVNGQGYYHEMNEYFKVKGLLIKYKNTLLIGDKLIESEDIGFFATEIGLRDLKNCCPFNFDEAFCSDFERVNRIGNGIGDHVDVSKVLVSRELVKKELENIDLEYYQKKV